MDDRRQIPDCPHCHNTGGVLIQLGMAKMRCIWCEHGKHWPPAPPRDGAGAEE